MRRLPGGTRGRWPQRFDPVRRYWGRRLLLIGVLLLVVPLLSACADDDENRSFANDPKTIAAQPTEPAPTARATTVAPVFPSPETLVKRRGAPEVVYVYVDGALRSVDRHASQVIVDDDIAAFASSPSGDEVAVLSARTTDSSGIAYSVGVYQPDGTVSRQFDDVLVVPAEAATPASGDGGEPAVAGLTWAAQGGRLLMVQSAGYLVDIPLDGSPREIKPGASIAGAFEAAWSPRGDAIGLLRRNDKGQGEVMMIDTTVEPARVTVVAPGSAQQSVERFEWMANGQGLLYLQVLRTGEGLAGGTIVQWDRETNATTIVATGGQAGPAGSVTWFSGSPDGKALAYRVAVPTGDGWSFNGLIVRSMRNGQVFRVPVPGDAAVTGAWWYADGLLRSQIVTVDGVASTVEIVLTYASGEQTQIAAYSLTGPSTPVASPIATPIASPMASPVASPIASPAASPVASPEATPLASPAAGP